MGRSSGDIVSVQGGGHVGVSESCDYGKRRERCVVSDSDSVAQAQEMPWPGSRAQAGAYPRLGPAGIVGGKKEQKESCKASGEAVGKCEFLTLNATSILALIVLLCNWSLSLTSSFVHVHQALLFFSLSSSSFYFRLLP
jgi:hypothetical protein